LYLIDNFRHHLNRPRAALGKTTIHVGSIGNLNARSVNNLTR
jgi:hypothetical protein